MKSPYDKVASALEGARQWNAHVGLAGCVVRRMRAEYFLGAGF